MGSRIAFATACGVGDLVRVVCQMWQAGQDHEACMSMQKKEKENTESCTQREPSVCQLACCHLSIPVLQLPYIL